MSTIRDSQAQLYTPIYDMFMIQALDEYTMVAPQIFQELDDETKDYKVDNISGLGRWQDTEEAEAGETEDPVLGYPKTYTHTKKTKTLQVSYEAVDDDEYALLSKMGQAEGLGRGARDKIEYDAAQILINAFSVAGPDGQYGYDSDHPKNREETGTTYSNLLSGAFSHDNLETAETTMQNNMFDMNGIPYALTGEISLVHPPALCGPVQRVLNERAMERPGTSQREINRFVGKGTKYKYKPVEWVYLSSALGGSDTAWHLIFPWLKYNKLIWRQRPHFVSWTDENTELYNFKGRTRYSVGYDNWRFGFGSTGS